MLLKELNPHIFLGCKGHWIDDVVVSKDTVVQEIQPGAGYKTGDFVLRIVGGTAIERLRLSLQCNGLDERWHI